MYYVHAAAACLQTLRIMQLGASCPQAPLCTVHSAMHCVDVLVSASEGILSKKQRKHAKMLEE